MINKSSTLQERLQFYRDKIFNKTNGEYALISEDITTMRGPAIIEHSICGTRYTVKRFDRFLENDNFYLCPKCVHHRNSQLTTDTFKEKYFSSKLSEEYEILTEYKTRKTKIIFLHKVCNREFLMRAGDFARGQRCPHCFGTPLKDTETFKKEVEVMGNGEYCLLDEYINTFTKIRLKHKTCGNIFKVAPRDFISVKQTRCPYCRHNKVNDFFSRLLKENNIKFEIEKNFKEIPRLRFDFFLSDYDLLIELDGIYHFKNVGKSEFTKQRKRDLTKNEFCLSEKRSLLRISFIKLTKSLQVTFNEVVKGIINGEIVLGENMMFVDGSSEQQHFNLKKYYTQMKI